MTVAAYTLTKDELRAFNRLRPEMGHAWAFWWKVGLRLGINFSPEEGPLPVVEKEKRSPNFNVTFVPRLMKKRKKVYVPELENDYED